MIRTPRRKDIMPVPGAKPRGRPFQPGNPGRPPGSKNKTTQALEQLAEGQAEQVFQKVLEQALKGDVASQRIVLDRVYVPPKARPINVPIPAINGPQDALSAIAAIFSAIGRGQLTPDETTALSLLVGRSIQIIELQDHERRIAALEQARGKRDEKDSPPAA
jgi:Family of unknown function (DUF5681)